MKIHFSLVSIAVSLATAPAALADTSVVQTAEAQWKTECSSCHIAYPPRLLSAKGWHQIMSGLDRHFGTDASVDAQSAAAIRAYLEQNAGSERRTSGTLRITETRWFRHKHDELSPAVWKRPAVKSASNCGACHAEAERGDFRERNIRIPR